MIVVNVLCTYIIKLLCTRSHSHIHPLATPPAKKRKVQKRSKAERTVEKAMESFMAYQREAEEKYQRNEEERWQREIEMEEKRRKEDQEHEMRMMRMMAQMFQGPGSSYHRQYEFDYLPSQHDNYD